LACLSCHDGTQAMNVLINQPGSGLTNATFQAGTASGANQTSGAISSGLVTMLGQDLKNDHPIGIQYGGGPASGEATLATYSFKDTDFNATTSATINGQAVWWVDTGTPSTRQKTDIQLYTRTAGALVNPQPFVECASCHDPHTTANPTFLRISNSGSAVCLACHIK
jgi:predicted CXXCH cytochrome family protein